MEAGMGKQRLEFFLACDNMVAGAFLGALGSGEKLACMPTTHL